MSRAQRRSGFTLVELLIGIGLLGLLLATLASLFYLALRSYNKTTQELDRTQQLRIALKQIGEDLSFANWVDPGRGSLGTPPYCNDPNVRPPRPPVPPATCEFTFMVIQPGWDSTWPTLTEPVALRIRYSLVGGTLTRELLDDTDATYSSRVLLQGLAPYSEVNPCGGSAISNPEGSLIKIELRLLRSTTPTQGSECDVVTTSSLFHIRQFDL